MAQNKYNRLFFEIMIYTREIIYDLQKYCLNGVKCTGKFPFWVVKDVNHDLLQIRILPFWKIGQIALNRQFRAVNHDLWNINLYPLNANILGTVILQ